jgi:serine/threonine protein kinase
MHIEEFTEELVAVIATEILNALNHLHNKLKIAHCSLDLSNVMCSEAVPNKNTSRFKLISFENARFIGSKKPPQLPEGFQTVG